MALVRLWWLALFLPFTVYSANVQVVGLFSGRAVVNIDGKQEILKKGVRGKSGALLIHADSEKAQIEIDGNVNTYPLGQHIGSSFIAQEKSVVRIEPDRSGMYLVDGRINNTRVRFLVDTGATIIAINGALADQLGIDYKKRGRPITVTTATKKQRAYMVNLDTVTVGSIKLYNIAAAITDGPEPSTPLLGNSFLNQVSIERKQRLLMLLK